MAPKQHSMNNFRSFNAVRQGRHEVRPGELPGNSCTGAKNRKAFTLVELLVVIVIIAMLVALLVPAVIGARARARRASCANNQGQVAKAIMQYEASKQHLPGYVNKLGPWTPKPGLDVLGENLSWVAVILEQMGHADLWKEWRRSKPAGLGTSVALSEVICPSDTAKSGKSGALSLVVNCGISNYGISGGTDDCEEYNDAFDPTKPDPYDRTASGLFFCHEKAAMAPLFQGNRPLTIALDGIADGASNTIMLSENLDATNWAVGSGSGIKQSDVGFVWWSTTAGFSWNAAVPDQVNVNALHEVVPANPRLLARPSSYHPGGVNAVFADGHLEFISDRVEYTIFRDQMISDQQTAAYLIP